MKLTNYGRKLIMNQNKIRSNKAINIIRFAHLDAQKAAR